MGVFMNKRLILVFASSIALSSVPARANEDLIRLGVGLGLHVLGETLKGGNRQQAAPRVQRSSQDSRSNRQSASQAAAQKRQPDTHVLAVQQDLSELGYTQVGKPDGFAGGNTSKAILAFKLDHGLEGDAKIDAEFIAALKEIKSAKGKPSAAPATATSAIAPVPVATTLVAAPAVANEIKPDTAKTEQAEVDMSAEEYAAAVAEEGPVSDTSSAVEATEEPATVAEAKPSSDAGGISISEDF